MTMESTEAAVDAPAADAEPRQADRTGEARHGAARAEGDGRAEPAGGPGPAATGQVGGGPPAPGQTGARVEAEEARAEPGGRVGSGETASALRSGPHRLGRPRRGDGPLAALVAADCLAAGVAAWTLGDPRAAVLGLVPALLVLVALHHQGGLYRTGPSSTALGELPGLLWRAALAWSAATTVIAVVRPGLTVGWHRLLCLIAAHVALAALLRGAVHGRLRRRRRRNPRSTLVVGHPAVARRVAAVLHEHPEYGMWPVGLVTPPVAPAPPAAPVPPAPHREPDEHTQTAHHRTARTGAGAAGRPELPVPELTSAEDVTRAVIQNSVRHAVLTRRAQGDQQTAALVRLFRGLGCTVWVVDGETVPGATTWHTEETGHLWGFPCARLAPPPRRAAARTAKRAVDLAVAAAALLVAAPVLALCALAIRAFDGPGVLFRQERVGVHGRPFTMLKFRSLRPASAHESDTRWSVADDRRMSPVGRFLRRTSLDELPQLWNVLRGDMSLVGPRPERPYFVRQFSKAYPGYAARDRMPAGITGLAQINGLRGDTSIEDRARFDNHYIETWSLWQDVQILLRTAGSLFRLGGS